MKKNDLIHGLENIEIPEVKLEHHKAKLKQALYYELFRKEKPPSVLDYLQNLAEVFTMISKNLKIVAPITILALAILVYQFVFAAPQAVAVLTMQVNPALKLVLDVDNQVNKAESLNDDAKAILSQLDLEGKTASQAIQLLTETAIAKGYMKEDKEIMLALHPIEDSSGNKELLALAPEIEKAVMEVLAKSSLKNEVTSIVVSAKLYEEAFADGILPITYADLIEDNVSQETILNLLALREQLGIEETKFIEEWETVSEAFIDLMEAGVAEQVAFDLMKGAIGADKTLDEVSTIVAAMIDLKEAGIDPQKGLDLLKMAGEQGVEQEKLLEEFTTLVAAKIDLVEAGISPEAADAILKEAIKADSNLEEVTTIVAAFIDLKEDGMAEAEALAKVKDALKKDPTLDTFDDILELEEDKIKKAKEKEATTEVKKENVKVEKSSTTQEENVNPNKTINSVNEESSAVEDAAAGSPPVQEPQDDNN
ncbi:MAG: anti-sigma-I factor RsgI family protein [Thermincolia bacterium]